MPAAPGFDPEKLRSPTSDLFPLPFLEKQESKGKLPLASSPPDWWVFRTEWHCTKRAFANRQVDLSHPDYKSTGRYLAWAGEARGPSRPSFMLPAATALLQLAGKPNPRGFCFLCLVENVCPTISDACDLNLHPLLQCELPFVLPGWVHRVLPHRVPICHWLWTFRINSAPMQNRQSTCRRCVWISVQESGSVFERI